MSLPLPRMSPLLLLAALQPKDVERLRHVPRFRPSRIFLVSSEVSSPRSSVRTEGEGHEPESAKGNDRRRKVMMLANRKVRVGGEADENGRQFRY
jgi:hypothetical protein